MVILEDKTDADIVVLPTTTLAVFMSSSALSPIRSMLVKSKVTSRPWQRWWSCGCVKGCRPLTFAC
jgi:hypothetical protein